MICDGLLNKCYFFISPQFKGLEKSLEIRIERLEERLKMYFAFLF